MKKITVLLLVLVSSVALAADAVRFTAKDGWIRSAPPGAQAMAGYATLVSESAAPLKIVDASSDAFEAVAFHESYEDQGMMRMRALSGLEVPGDGSLTLAPGGVHLMLMRPKRDIREGATVLVDLVTEDGDLLPVAMKVRKGEGDDDAHDHEHAHH